MGHSEHGSQSFYPLPRLYAVIVPQDFQNYQDHFFPIVNSFCTVPEPLNIIF